MNSRFTPATFSAANRSWWDHDAANYHAQHPEYLSSFYWCPEMLHEEQAQLLGDVSDTTVLELGCGSAPCSRWLAERFPTARIIGVDISEQMLRRAAIDDATLHLLHADALALPLRPRSVDTVFSVFGALPFIEDLSAAFAEVSRVLRPGGRFVFSVNHPMRWIFADDPSAEGLHVAYSYFDDAYTEADDQGVLSYAEGHHTVSDYANGLVAAGLSIRHMIEPEWPEDLETTWGQWSPLRGRIFPGTLIISARKD
ncbi:class I SAM-dependent methyltransferase [Corynebacterium sp. TAE3-ERU2]|uniref:class I SAM-dependent DNA methyltransferase n=1 Tax=Corynebacterium sp. TAE3-ERU2 TaxID=2849497 RepID=UPI001C46C898|nr:class I SAM-dependent methyltransferase [Corynebacterium sp. TAE3-ERU2]MBV7301063.1 class I SAM-dependent methyltransferase [Corynebacterium sp. TAE3-ERU2]